MLIVGLHGSDDHHDYDDDNEALNFSKDDYTDSEDEDELATHEN